MSRQSSDKRKLVIVGDGAVGKTCLLAKFKDGDFNPERYVPTIFENHVVSFQVDGIQRNLELWDTAGQDDYEYLRPLSYQATDIILMCFGIDNPDSLENLKERWAPEVAHFCRGVPIIVVGLKADLRTNPEVLRQLKLVREKPVDTRQGAEMARYLHAAKYIECSALTGQGVQDVFKWAGRLAFGQATSTQRPGRVSPERREVKQKRSAEGIGCGCVIC